MAKLKAPPRMLLCHMQKREAQGLDMGQGGPQLDMEMPPEARLRTYAPWSQLIKLPEIQQLFKDVVADKNADGKIDPPFIAPYKEAEKRIPKWVPAPGDSYPFFKKLAAKGRGGDNIMVWLPEDVVVFFGKLKGGLSENPKTGYLEFGNFFKDLFHNPIKTLAEPIRVVGTLAGAYFGGPLGAGAGNALASLMTGKKVGDSLISGAKNAALAYGVKTSLPHLASWGVPGAAGMQGALAGTPMAAATSAAAKTGAAGAQGATQGGGGWFQNLLGGSGGAAPGSSLGALGAFAGHPLLTHAITGLLKIQADKDMYRREMEAREKYRQQQWEDLNRMGLVSHFNPSQEGSRRSLHNTPGYGEMSQQDLMRGQIRQAPLQYYAEGGSVGGHYTSPSVHVKKAYSNYVKGPGKGQDDKVYTKVPPNTYIVDATSVSMAGDGSTEAGAKAWGNWEKKVLSHLGKMAPGPKGKKERGPKVDVALSAGEKALDPRVIEIVGEGNPKAGARFMDAMRANIRADKSRNMGGLPPKIKPLNMYMPKR